MDKRGPKIGDAASLWNFTPSPGWTKEESLVLKLCLMKFGIGQWIQIQATGLLPGKLIQQLNGATQRLVGQQSLAAFSGLRVDVDRVRADNEARTDARRKNGLIIWGGPNPTKEMKLQWQQEARDKYSLTPEQQTEVEAAFEAMAAAAAAAAVPAAPAAGAAAGAATPTAATAAGHQGLPRGTDILSCDVEQLSLGQKQQLLCALHVRLQQVLGVAVLRLPQLGQLVTNLQQQQQQQQQNGGSGSSWIVTGLPVALPAAAGGGGGAAASSSSAAAAAAAAAVAAAAGFDSDASKENRQPQGANLLVRQAGTAAAAAGRTGKQGRPKGSSKGGGSTKPPGGKKRCRGPKGPAAAAADDDDAEAAFLRRQQPRRRHGSSNSSSGGGGGGLFADMMRVALEAGVAQLVDMGYSRAKALDALQECNCDVEAAVEYLTAACC